MNTRVLTAAACAGTLVAALLVGYAQPAVAAPHDTTFVSRAASPADGFSIHPRISGNGRYVAFLSVADNLSAEDDNAYRNLFVRDLAAGTTTLASRANGAAGAAANADSAEPSISADGRYVAFSSTASNLSPDDRDACRDAWSGADAPCSNVFVRDLVAGTTTYVSRAADPSDGASFTPAITPDGRRVVFQSVGANLSNADRDVCVGHSETGEFEKPCQNYFLRDLAAGTTAYIAPGPHEYWGWFCSPAVSPDGNLVAVESDAPLAAGDGNGMVDVYLVDLRNGAATLASRTDADGAGNGHSSCGSVATDGRRVAFESSASNLTPNGFPAWSSWPEVYVRDLVAGTTTLISRSDWSSALGYPSGGPSISGDGRLVAFHSNAANIDPDGVGAFVRDLQTGTLTRVSRATGANGAPADGWEPSMSTDGRLVAFYSEGDAISTEDDDRQGNVFVRELAPPSTAAAADLSLAMTASPTAPTVGAQVTFTLTVSNAGPAGATGVAVTDRLPAGLTYVSANPSQGGYAAATGVWSVGGLASGAGATLGLVARVDNTGALANTAQVTAADQADPDSAPGNSTAGEDDQATATVTGQPSCGSARVTANADTWVAQEAPSSNYGRNTVLKARSKAYANNRALVRFALPAVPGGCKPTGATLRLYASAAATGRTLQAIRVSSTWSETSVTWNSRPSTTGTAVTATSKTGWVPWTVTSQVQAMYAGPNHGFLVRDASESGAGAEQRFHSREAATSTPPELTVTFGPA